MVVALAFVLTVGPVERFPNSRKLVSYWGLNPRENSSGGRQRLGSISKQGNTMMRWLLVEAAQTAARLDPQLRRIYQRLKKQRRRAGWRKSPSPAVWPSGCSGCCARATIMRSSFTCPVARVARWFRPTAEPKV